MTDVEDRPVGDEPDQSNQPAPGRDRSWRVSHWFLLGVLGCVLVGFGIRWTNIAVARPVCHPPGADPDSDCYELYAGPSDPLYGHLQGRLIAQGHWFVNPYVALSGENGESAEQRAIDADATGSFRTSVGDPPLYQVFLAALTAGGIESGQGHRHASAVVGLATIPLLALLARRLASEGAGLAAAALAAVHPLLWINDGMLLSEALYAPLIAGVLLAAVWYHDRPGAGPVAVLTLLITLATFTRGEAGLLLPLLVAALVLATRSIPLRRRFALGAIALGVAGAFFLPWNLWINARFDEQVFMTAASGSVLSASACDQHFYGEPLALFIYCPVDVDVPDGADESEQDALVRDAALDYIGDNSSRLPVVAAVRAGRMWDLYGPAENLDQAIGVEDRGDLPSRVGLGVYYALFPFSIVGLIALRRRGELVLPYLALAATVTITAASTFGLTRYRTPVDVAMVALGAVGIDAIVRALAQRQHRRTVS
ncbi:MAG: glycosyltransferase family 39 protein [Acidimicrobiales bacterium]|nr:glycosyltransferase family 39 protein [Acidimicrobiales bacterium]